MSRSNWDTQELIDAASRHEALPSRQRMVGVREAVLRRALIGGAVTVAGSTTFLAKAAALGATTVANVAVPSVTTTVSLPSTALSSTMLTWMFFWVSPGMNVSGDAVPTV